MNGRGAGADHKSEKGCDHHLASRHILTQPQYFITASGESGAVAVLAHSGFFDTGLPRALPPRIRAPKSGSALRFNRAISDDSDELDSIFWVQPAGAPDEPI